MEHFKIALGVAVFLVGGHVSCSAANWQDTALKAVKSEDVVVDARWRNKGQNVLWVAAADDGTNRDGFAQYLCEVMSAEGAPADQLKSVWIYPPAAFDRGGKALGMAACK